MKKESHSVTSKNQENLVLGLNIDGEIVQFNKTCQQITGYKRSEVLNKKIYDLLIPKSYIKNWEKILESVIKNKNINDFKIPLNTFDGKEVMISWDSMPLENGKKGIKNICFVGKNIEKNQQKRTTHKIITVKNNYFIDLSNVKNDNSVDDEMKINSKKIAMDHAKLDKILKDKSNKLDKKTIEKSKRNCNSGKVKSDEKIIFKEYNLDNIESNDNIKNGNIFSKNLNYKKKSSNSEITKVDFKDLLKNYNKLNNKLKDLEKKDRKLDRKNKILEKNINNLREQIKKGYIVDSDNEQKSDVSNLIEIKKDKSLLNKIPIFLHNPFDNKKKNIELEIQMKTIEERTKELEEIEARLIKDRKIQDKRMAEFASWKEKLLNLEEEIEKRRKDLIEQEESFTQQLISSPINEINQEDVSAVIQDDLVSEDVTEIDDSHHDILDKIPQCAAIIQRSILKQINSAFSELIGFENDEIIDKSFFDFISPEGLNGIEKYYLGRLKGNECSSFETIFSTKQNNDIKVEVSVKPTVYNGQKAEIAIITYMDDQEKCKKGTVNESEDLKNDNKAEDSSIKKELNIENNQSVEDEDVTKKLESEKQNDDGTEKKLEEDEKESSA